MKFVLSKKILKKKAAKLAREQDKLDSLNPFVSETLLPGQEYSAQHDFVEKIRADVAAHHNNLQKASQII